MCSNHCSQLVTECNTLASYTSTCMFNSINMYANHIYNFSGELQPGSIARQYCILLIMSYVLRLGLGNMFSLIHS